MDEILGNIQLWELYFEEITMIDYVINRDYVNQRFQSRIKTDNLRPNNHVYRTIISKINDGITTDPDRHGVSYWGVFRPKI